MAGDEMKLEIFNGNGADDLEQYWFLCEAIQTTRKTTDDDVKKRQLATTLRGRTLEWFMRFTRVPQGRTAKKLDEIRTRLFEEFKKPKSKSQFITKIKEIKKFSTEYVWDFDQIFKTLMTKVSFNMLDMHQKEWFIAVLLPHIWIPLM